MALALDINPECFFADDGQISSPQPDLV